METITRLKEIIGNFVKRLLHKGSQTQQISNNRDSFDRYEYYPRKIEKELLLDDSRRKSTQLK